MVRRSLELIENQVHLGQRILVKPNIVSVRKPLSATHPDALERIRILGDRLEDCVRPFEPHPSYARQKMWKKDEIEALHPPLAQNPVPARP